MDTRIGSGRGATQYRGLQDGWIVYQFTWNERNVQVTGPMARDENRWTDTQPTLAGVAWGSEARKATSEGMRAMRV